MSVTDWTGIHWDTDSLHWDTQTINTADTGCHIYDRA